MATESQKAEADSRRACDWRTLPNSNAAPPLVDPFGTDRIRDLARRSPVVKCYLSAWVRGDISWDLMLVELVAALVAVAFLSPFTGTWTQEAIAVTPSADGPTVVPAEQA